MFPRKPPVDQPTFALSSGATDVRTAFPIVCRLTDCGASPRLKVSA
jgi:hypothetical protein